MKDAKNTNRLDLRDYIRNVPDFPKKGIQFKDVTPLLNQPEAFKQAVRDMISLYDMNSIDKIVGLEARGFIFGAAMAYEANKPFVPMRKPGKLPYSCIRESYGLEYGKDSIEVHTDAILPNERVLVIDDLLATGGTLKAATSLVERLGAEVVGCGILIELDDLRGKDKLSKYQVRSCLHY